MSFTEDFLGLLLELFALFHKGSYSGSTNAFMGHVESLP